MKTTDTKKSNDIQQNKLIEDALKTSGFLFPETVEEVEEFERIYGQTEVILPRELQEPTFLYFETENGHFIKTISLTLDNFAMVAREGLSKLPIDIQQRIIDDIKKTES